MISAPQTGSSNVENIADLHNHLNYDYALIAPRINQYGTLSKFSITEIQTRVSKTGIPLRLNPLLRKYLI